MTNIADNDNEFFVSGTELVYLEQTDLLLDWLLDI